MATFVFSGDPRAPGCDPATCEIFGMVFPHGKPVEVKDDATAEKLRRHSHFTEGKAAAKTEQPSDDIDHMNIADLRELAEQRGIDHADMSKAELREALRAV